MVSTSKISYLCIQIEDLLLTSNPKTAPAYSLALLHTTLKCEGHSHLPTFQGGRLCVRGSKNHYSTSLCAQSDNSIMPNHVFISRASFSRVLTVLSGGPNYKDSFTLNNDFISLVVDSTFRCMLHWGMENPPFRRDASKGNTFKLNIRIQRSFLHKNLPQIRFRIGEPLLVLIAAM